MEKNDKSKTEKDTFGHKRVLMDETHVVNIGRLPVMVNSNLCWLRELRESDCLYDSGGYFLIRGMEKVLFYCSLLI